MRRLFLFVAVLSLTACQLRSADTYYDADTVTTIAAAPLTLDEAIGQMLLVGFRGTTIDSTHHIVRDIRD